MSTTEKPSLMQNLKLNVRRFGEMSTLSEFTIQLLIYSNVALCIHNLFNSSDSPVTPSLVPVDPIPAVAPEVPDLSAQFPTAETLLNGPFHIQIPEVQSPRFSGERTDLRIELNGPLPAPGDSSIDPTLDVKNRSPVKMEGRWIFP